jgi:hypothetical protein
VADFCERSYETLGSVGGGGVTVGLSGGVMLRGDGLYFEMNNTIHL